MNPYQFTVTCDVCGGPGAGDARANAAQWLKGGFVSHRNPRICADYLAEKKRKDAEAKAATGG